MKKSYWFGKTHSDESKKKISENHADVKGKNNSHYGKELLQETKDKISKTNKENGKVLGEKNPAAKLTEEKVIEIKKILLEGKLSQKEIAKIYSMGTTAINYIKSGKSWSHVKLNDYNISSS